MRTKNLIISVGVLSVLGLMFFTLTSTDGIRKYHPRNAEKEFTSANGAAEWMDRRRVNLQTGVINSADVNKAWADVLQMNMFKSESAINMTWTELGPDNVGGRTRSLIIDKDNENVIIAGSVSGGIWKTTSGGLSWVKANGGDLYQNLCISSMCQTANGDMYAGTGEYFTYSSKRGFRGNGILKSTDHGTNWTFISSTTTASEFQIVTELAAHPTNPNKIYATTLQGLRISTDGGSTWTNPIPSTDSNYVLPATDVKLSADGNIIIMSLNNKAYLCTAGNDIFTNISGATTIPTEEIGRLEFAISKSNSNYIYCLAAKSDGSLKNVYISSNAGTSWTPMLSVIGTQFNIFGSINPQGVYDNAIAVYPDDPEHILMGGIDLWSYTPDEPWQQITSWDFSTLSPIYIHADIHAIVFSPSYSSSNKMIYVSSDGGVYRSTDGGTFWQTMNKNYNTVQFYTVAYSATGAVIGGTQDNGTIRIDYTGTTLTSGSMALGGDGGGTVYSMLNPQVVFSTLYFGDIRRSDKAGDIYSYSATLEMLSTNLTTAHPNIGKSSEPFVTPIALHENFYDTNSVQNLMYIPEDPLVAGNTISVFSQCGKRIRYTITAADVVAAGDTIDENDTLYVQDTYQSCLALGLNNRVWITWEGINFSKIPPRWHPITNISGMGEVQTIEFSADGDHLFFATWNGSVCKLFRSSNILSARDSATADWHSAAIAVVTQELGTFSQMITSIAPDPGNINNLVITLGNYGNTDYVYYSNVAATTTSTLAGDNFTSKQGNLPAMPVYSSIINWSDGKVVIIGTEYGIFATEDITAGTVSWTSQNGNAMPNVQVLQLRQQTTRNGWLPVPGILTGITNHGVIYAATHGRGIWKCVDYQGPVGMPDMSASQELQINVKVFPNPITDYASVSYNLEKSGNVTIRIYSIMGSLVHEYKVKGTAGSNTEVLQNINLQQGTYLITVESNGKKATSKFIAF